MSCLCDKCENLELLIDGINRCIPEYRNQKHPNNCHDLLSLVVCSPDNFACASGDCQNCPNGINMEVIRNTDMISVYQWGNSPGNKYPEKMSHMMSGAECAECFASSLDDVKLHNFLKTNQHATFRQQKETLKPNEILVHVDFSENYDNKQQNAIQSAYF